MYEACRRMGHAWEEIPASLAERPAIERDVWLRCVRCTMLRAFDINEDGTTDWVRYFPPQGYNWDRSQGAAPRKADYRLAWLRDILAREKG